MPKHAGGAHARPRDGLRSGMAIATTRGRHARMPGLAPTLLMGLSVGGMVVGSALPGASTVGEISPPPQTAQVSLRSGLPPVLDPVDMADERIELRAERRRQPPAVEPAPAPTAAAPVPAPPAKPTVPAPPAKPTAPVLPGCNGTRPLVQHSNGRLPDSVLCALPGPSRQPLRADAAVAFVGLAAEYRRHFGTSICVTDGYRTLSQQQALSRAKPGLSAPPGTSVHGLGLAVDLACGVQSFRSPQHAWLRENAGRYGWYLPTWARQGGSKPEPWHWEYRG